MIGLPDDHTYITVLQATEFVTGIQRSDRRRKDDFSSARNKINNASKARYNRLPRDKGGILFGNLKKWVAHSGNEVWAKRIGIDPPQVIDLSGEAENVSNFGVARVRHGDLVVAYTDMAEKYEAATRKLEDALQVARDNQVDADRHRKLSHSKTKEGRAEKERELAAKIDVATK